MESCKQAGVKEVPVIVKEYTEQEIVEIGLIENIQRENLNPIEEAMAFKRLLEEFNLKQVKWPELCIKKQNCSHKLYATSEIGRACSANDY